MKNILAAAVIILAFLICNCIAAIAGVVGTQCWINGKLVGGFPPGYVCPGTGGGSDFSPAPSYDYEAERQRQETERMIQEQAERERQRASDEERRLREEEEAKARKRQEEFERAKQDALRGMKGFTENELGLKGADSGEFGLKGAGEGGTIGLGLKGVGDTDTGRFGLKGVGDPTPRRSAVSEPSEQKMREEIDAAGRRIPELRKEIRGLQTLLRQFGASQRGNISEFEKWDETFRGAAENSRKNALEYGLSMFFQYNLMGSLEKRVRQDVYGKLDGLINSSDPKIRRWLGEQLRKRNIELDRVKKAVAVGSLGGDLAALLPAYTPGNLKQLPGDLAETGKALDTLLFVNDLLETTKIVSWSGSQYFQQAKMIGETYTDLAAFGFSAVGVREVGKATDAYNREISRLSTRLKGSVQEMNCLKGCLEEYTERCMDMCTGKSRFGTPPPAPR